MKTVVTCNGCFDGLHPGHLFFLGYAAGQGDELIVGLNSDAYIRRHKREPHFTEKEREKMLYGSGVVSEIRVFDEDTPNEFIAQVEPDVHCTGEEDGFDCPESKVLKIMGVELLLVPRVGTWATSTISEEYIQWLKGAVKKNLI